MFHNATRTTKRRLKNRDTWKERATEVAREAGLEEPPREHKRAAHNRHGRALAVMASAPAVTATVAVMATEHCGHH